MSILKVKDKDGKFVDVPVISGRPASIRVGEVKLLEPNSEPTIENVGTEYDAIFDFGIPKGEYIVQGEDFRLDLSDYAKQKQLDKEILNRQQTDNSLQSQIKSLASGSPKGVYTDVTALKTANPDTGVYITSDNGHIYSWTKNSESEPVDLGIYQATELEDNSVTDSKIHDISIEKVIETTTETTENLFDKSKATYGYYNSNGTFVNGRNIYQDTIFDWYTSDYIECSANENFMKSKLGQSNVIYFDSNKNFISFETIYQNTITVPDNSNISYMRVQFIVYSNKQERYRYCCKLSEMMIVKGTTLPDYYIPYKNITINNNVTPLATQAKGVVWDTDWAYDTDDIVACRVLLWAERQGLIDIVAVVNSHYVPKAVQSLDAFLTYEGRPNLAIGIDQTVKWSGDSGTWHDSMITHPYSITTTQAEDAVKTYRRALTAAKEPIDIIVVGSLLNIYNLMLSTPDNISDLGGSELLNKKCSRIWVMGGQYPSGSEANFNSSRGKEKTAYVCANCTVPMTFLGYEAGLIKTGANIIDREDWDPLAKALVETNRITGGYSWDPLLTWVACVGKPEQCGFDVIKGTNTVANDGSNTFTTDNVGHHEYLVLNHPNAWYQNEINTILERNAWDLREVGKKQIPRVIVSE